MRHTEQIASHRGHTSPTRQHSSCAALALALVCALSPACTPIAAVSRDDNPATLSPTDVDPTGNNAIGSAGNGSSRFPGAPGSADVATAQISSQCSEAGKRACASVDQRMPLLCKDAVWQPQDACGELERCETQVGPELGTCVPIATECLSHQASEDFCDGEFLRSCENLVLNGARSCPDRRRCKEVDNMARCVCAERWVETVTGECEVPSTCSVGNGGCDMTTTCDASSGQRVCGPCQPGFEGTGETGCHAQLSLLSLEGLTLDPVFSPEVHSYRVALPLLRQSIRVTTQTVSGVKIAFDSVEQEPGSVWQSPPFALGERKIEINLSAESGLKSKYELLVSRAGVQEAYLKASNPEATDELGGNVAIWGDTIAIGAAGEDSGSSTNQADDSAQESGAVYVFVRKGNTWVQQGYLKADPPRSADYFGGSIALREDMLVVGAPGANIVGATTPHGGSVHVFKRQGEKWTLLRKLVPEDTGLQDGFGWSVALDDKRLIAGAAMEGSEQRFSGAVYAFSRTGDTFGEPVRFKADKPLASGLFGWSVALDGENLVVGAPQYNAIFTPGDSGSGTAYVFTANGEQWTQVQELMPSASLEEGATMGWAVAVAGDTIAVGAPRGRATDEGQPPGDVFIYERASGGGWGLKKNLQAAVPRVSDWYGWSVKLSATVLAVGAPGDDSGSMGLIGDPNNDAARASGAVFLYARDKDDWVSTTFIKASNPGLNDNFGGLIGLSDDTLVTTATGESSDAAGVNGDQVSEAAPRAGAAYVFR